MVVNVYVYLFPQLCFICVHMPISVNRRETLKGPSIPDLTQPTISVTHDDFFALGMCCPSPDITVKYPVSWHPFPDPPSKTLEEYEATGGNRQGGRGGTFQVCVGPILTQHMRGLGGVLFTACVGAVLTHPIGGVLWYVLLCCVVFVLCYVVLCCVMLCCVVLCCVIAFFVLGFFLVSFCAVFFFFILLCCVVWCSVVTQHNTTQHNTTQHNTTQHNTTQHNTTQHNTTQHKIFGFLCCHGVDKGGWGVLLRPVLGLC